ncbi:hypothetical protein QO034_10875 [Sedimentitalea sp. JM2-8]|uniref:PH domain-containing protein n=1 Tax=Sedimentitalea xiamensis TaxID=3050037 RepID=A0ABT7FER5_9RHOB|nr:hypothetical protein [Sedimentitalea xiamensis]MDK3073615.1 hypothetical protein [Sedimentitalea xiamensis]
MTADVFVFVRPGRSRRTLAVLIPVYATLIGLFVLVDAAWWVIGLLALPTLPALWDLWRNPSAGVRLDATRIRWHSGRRSGALALNEIDHMRFDTRWDFSVRVSAVLKGDKRVHLPFESTPPHREFETAFEDRRIPVKRTHFSFF